MSLKLDITPVFERSDEEFDSIYPIKIQKLSTRHWTPVAVAKRAADFLIDSPGTRILDIGSGVGKFCLVAAAYSQGIFTGVEQRESLIRISQKVAHRYQIERVKFIHANIQSVNFSEYDAFYFFNSFEENLDLSDKIDEDANLNVELFDTYTHYIRKQFEAAPMGTKIATYCTTCNEIPLSYTLLKTGIKGKMKFWQKRH